MRYLHVMTRAGSSCDESKASGMHTLSHGDQMQVSIKCQGQVADIYIVVGAKAGSKGQGQVEAHWQLCCPDYMYSLMVA